MIERAGRAGDRVRRRRIHRPLCLRMPVQGAASGFASPSAIRARAYIIQPLGQVGQFGFAKADVTNARQRSRSGQGRDRGRSTSCGVFGKAMQRVHVDGARNVAEAAREPGASAAGPHFRHRRRPGIAIRLRPHQGRGRGRGPQGVPERPRSSGRRWCSGRRTSSPTASRQWRGCRSFRSSPPERNFQPVYVRDLARAIAKAALDPQRFGGKTYEIGGPQVMSMIELHRAILAHHRPGPGARRRCPICSGALLSKLGWLPGAPLTRDQWLMLQRDNLPRATRPASKRSGSARRRSARSAMNGWAASTPAASSPAGAFI